MEEYKQNFLQFVSLYLNYSDVWKRKYWLESTSSRLHLIISLNNNWRNNWRNVRAEKYIPSAIVLFLEDTRARMSNRNKAK